MARRRQAMVRAVRRGASLRAVARQFHVSPTTIQRGVERAHGQRLDRAEWRNHSSAPQRVANRVRPELEDRVLQIRRARRDQSDLGEFGAVAIRRELLQRGLAAPPSRRTIGRILARRGALDSRHRVRRKAPPGGWSLPEVAARQAALDEFDIVEGLVMKGGPEVIVLNGLSWPGGLLESWPRTSMTAAVTRAALVEHWRAVGLPA
jgi:transposase-like protein